MPTYEDLIERNWFDEFVPRMNPKFYSYFGRWFDDEERAEDLTHRLWTKLLSDDGFSAHVREASISEDDLIHQERWLWNVADNLRKDEYRKDQVRTRSRGQIEPPEGEKNPEENYEPKEKINCVERVLSQMENEKHRKTLELSRDGHSFKEIAEKIGLEVGSLGTTLYRARRAFKKILCGICPEVCFEMCGGDGDPCWRVTA